MAGQERCMIYKTGPTIRPTIKNQRPSSPLCQNCCRTKICCDAIAWPDTGERCCTVCEHDRGETYGEHPPTPHLARR